MEKLKTEAGLSEENSNYKDVIVYLFEQKENAIKLLNEYFFYLRQMEIVSDYDDIRDPDEIKQSAKDDALNDIKVNKII